MRLALPLAVLLASDALARAPHSGRYERRRERRGAVTDTSPKVTTTSFIADRREPPLELALFVETAAARVPFDPTLLPLRVGLSYGGVGPALTVSPRRFALSWTDGAPPVVAMTNDELRDVPGGVNSLAHDERLLARVGQPPPFIAADGLRRPVRFYADPATGVYLLDDTRLVPGTWFVDTLCFRVPAGFDRSRPLFELSFLGHDDSPAVTASFRLEPDPFAHSRAFRKARHARAKEDASAKRARKRAEKAAGEP